LTQAGSLPAALDSLNRSAQSISPQSSDDPTREIDIRLVLPYHGAIQEKYDQLQQVASFPVPYEDGPALAVVYEKEVNGLLVYFVGGLPFPPGLPVYTNDNLRDGYRYTFFSLAALELTRILDWRPDILHANDWHTAPAVYSLMLRRQKEKFFRKTASILTVHNLPYMGIGAGPALQGFGLPPAIGSALPLWAQDAPLPLGLWAADKIVAVSPSYAKEILTPEYGAGLDEFLRSR
jgi:starch synthase